MKNLVSLVLALMIAIFVGVINAITVAAKNNRAERRMNHSDGYVGKFAIIFATIITIIIVCFVLVELPQGMPMVLLSVRKKNKNYVRSTWEDNGRFYYLRMESNGKVSEKETSVCPVMEFKGYDATACLQFAWSGVYSKPPRFVYHNGYKYVLIGGTNGGIKSGTSWYVRSDFYRLNKKVFNKDYIVYADKEAVKWLTDIEDAYDRINEIGNPSDNKAFEEKAKLLQVIENNEKRLEEAEKELINSKLTTARAIQLADLVFPSSKRIGHPIGMDRICVYDDFEVVRSVPSGMKYTLEYKLVPCKKTELKATDGAIRIPLSVAVVMSIANKPGVYQVTGTNGSIKGLAIIFDDEKDRKLYGTSDAKAPAAIWSDCGKQENSVTFFKSTIKDVALFSSTEEYAADKVQLRWREKHTNVSGYVTMARQIFEACFAFANPEDIMEASKRTIDKIKELSTKEGFMKQANKALPETRRNSWKQLAYATPLRNTIAKQVSYMVDEALCGGIEVQGFELFPVPDMNAVNNRTAFNGVTNRPELNEFECKIDVNLAKKIQKQLGLKELDDVKGVQVVIYRFPFGNIEQAVFTITEFTDIPGVIEVPFGTIAMLMLDMDFDGDHVMVVFEPAVVRAAKRTNEFVKAAGAQTRAYESLQATDKQTKTSIINYLSYGYLTGQDVALMSSNMFPNFGMIPFPMSDVNELDTPVCIDGIPVTNARITANAAQEIKAAVNNGADETKAGTKAEWETDYSKFLNGIKQKFVVFSQFHAHPGELDVAINGNGQVGFKKPDDDEGKTWRRPLPIVSCTEWLRQYIMTELTGDPFCIYVNLETGKREYRLLWKTEANPKGLIWMPPMKGEEGAFAGISPEIWRRQTGNDWYDALESPLNMAFPEKFSVTLPNGKVVSNDNLIEFLTMGYGAIGQKGGNDENKINLMPSAYTGCLTVGLYWNRLKNKLAEINRRDSSPTSATFIRNDVKERVEEVIFIMFAAAGMPISMKTAEVMLFDELGDYLLSGRATEAAAGDLRYYFDTYGKWLKK